MLIWKRQNADWIKSFTYRLPIKAVGHREMFIMCPIEYFILLFNRVVLYPIHWIYREFTYIGYKIMYEWFDFQNWQGTVDLEIFEKERCKFLKQRSREIYANRWSSLKHNYFYNLIISY